jgi:hypothetical protein
MGKMHDKFKDLNMKRHAYINSRDLAGASVIQQTGLDTPEGLQRMISILLHKMDPEGKGVILTLEDMQKYADAAILEGRVNMLVNGLNDHLLFKLCTNAEMANAEAHAAEVFKAAGLDKVK